MSSSPSLEIVVAQQLGGSAAVLFTSSAGTWTRIEKVTLVNTDSASHQVTLYLVPSGGSAATNTLITMTQAISPGQSLNDVNVPGHYLNPGDALWGYADTGAKVNVMVGGTEFT